MAGAKGQVEPAMKASAKDVDRPMVAMEAGLEPVDSRREPELLI